MQSGESIAVIHKEDVVFYIEYDTVHMEEEYDLHVEIENILYPED